MSKKDRLKKEKIYVIRKKGGYIVVVEGDGEGHLEERKKEDRDTIAQLEELIELRAELGVRISNLLIKDLKLTTCSANHATHTTGAGDYDPKPKPTKKPKPKKK